MWILMETKSEWMTRYHYCCLLGVYNTKEDAQQALESRYDKLSSSPEFWEGDVDELSGWLEGCGTTDGDYGYIWEIEHVAQSNEAIKREE